MSDPQVPEEGDRPDFTSINAYAEGAAKAAAHPARATLASLGWDEAATMIDLEGRVPIIASLRECVQHFTLYKPHARENARLLLPRPVHREGRATRTWLLEPGEIAVLAERLEKKD